MDWFSKRSPIHNRSTSCRQQTVYCLWKGFEYCCLDGQTSHEKRQSAINAYITCLEVKSLFSCWAPGQVVWGSIWPWQILWFCMTVIGTLKWTCRLWCVAVYVNFDLVLIPQYGSSSILSDSPPCACHDGQSLKAHRSKVCWTPKESKLFQYITSNQWINSM